jgi:hypothetical protein
MKDGDTFAGAVNCMDGRTQEPVAAWLKAEYGVKYVDQMTEPGPIRILADCPDDPRVEALRTRVGISVGKHHARAIAVVAHYDCAGNPVDRPEQERQLARSLDIVKSWAPDTPVVGVWVNEEWQVEKVAER